MLDFNFNFTHLAVAIFGIVAGGGVATCAYLIYDRKQVDEILNTDPPLQVPDMQVVISMYKNKPIKAVAYTANETRLPDCVQDDAISKAISELGYTKPLQAVCTKSTTLEPVLVEVEPEPVEEGLDAVYPKTVNEVVDKMQGKRNAQASEFKAN